MPAWMHKLGHPLIALTGAWAVGSVAWSGLHDPIKTTPAADCSRPGTRRVLSPADMETLQRDGVVVVDANISADSLARLRRYATKQFGKMTCDHQNPSDVRTDHVTWVQKLDLRALAALEKNDQENKRDTDNGSGGAAGSKDDEFGALDLDACVGLLRGLSSELDDSPMYSRTKNHASPVDLQLSCYDGRKSFYTAHRDTPTFEGASTSIFTLGLKGWLQAQHYRKRVVTALLYLNESDWDVERDGGGLRLYLGAEPDDDIGDSAKEVQVVNPVGGTLVVFDRYVR
eukprot:INCI16224.2.p1 GENE.INCI16224.2~~INCI16224.2.p1  ORF type:complete len:286 (+),score=36.33 INCI16224.2:211-1068(+)